MNAVDIIILTVVGLCAFAGFRRGLLHTVYRLVSIFVALFLAFRLYPHVSRMLRQTGLFGSIQRSISRAMNLEAVFNEHAAARGTEIIDALPLPAALRSLLHVNNTPNMYELLRVYTLEDYITGFFANMVINGIAVLAVFLLVMVILGLIGGLLDIVGKLPVINTLNNVGGLAIGSLLGMLLGWAGVAIMIMMFTSTGSPLMYDLLQGSFVARFFLDNEFILPRLTLV